MFLGLDLAPRKCGWCAGSGLDTPIAGGFRITADMSDLAGVLEETRENLMAVLQRFKPSAVMVESPILPSNRRRGAAGPVIGSLAQRRAQMGQNAFVEWLVVTIRERPMNIGVSGWYVECFETDLWSIKDSLTGNKSASKEEMVAMALKLGVELPDVLADGREDAADALGAWLMLVRHSSLDLAQQWDRRIHSSKGALL